MAEAIFNNLCDVEYLTSSSCGISVIRNSEASEYAIKTLNEKLKVNISNRRAVQLTKEHLKEAGYVLVMTKGIKNLLVKKVPEIADRVFTVNEFAEVSGEINDPYGMDMRVYEDTFIQLNNCIINILKKLKEDRLTN